MTTTPWGGSVDYRATTGSTMDDAQALEDGGASEGSVAWAGFQTAGRGRHAGRAWHASPDASLLFTIFWSPRQFRVPEFAPSLVVGLGLCYWLEELGVGRSVRLKWPNDVYLADRKLAGILVRQRWSASGPGRIHAGIGINLLPPSETGFRTAATSLADAGLALTPTGALESLLPSLKRALDHPHPQAECQARLWRLGQEMDLALPGEPASRRGLVRGLDGEGRLLWDGPGGLEAVSSGE